jgi:ribulose-5-phosphate 4-epimerase/fuculose-1-phosphate aldolase
MIDGIIKYNFDFTKSIPLKKSLWKKIEKTRERLYALKLIGIKEGIGYGNISQRISQHSFVITGTQTGHLKSLDNRDYSLIEDYNDREFFLKSSGAIKPSSEALTHGTIYNLSPNIGAVIHIHSKTMWNFMLKNSYKKTQNVPYGSTQMIEEVQRIYQNNNPLKNSKFVMSGHEEGVITFGKNLKEAEITLYNIISKIVINSK